MLPPMRHMLALLAVCPLATPKSVTISNIVERRDVCVSPEPHHQPGRPPVQTQPASMQLLTPPRRHGTPMDAHDGKVVQWEKGGPYYWYGMEYGNVTEGKTGCSQEHRDAAGFRADHNVSVWRSPDLVSWELAERATISIADRPLGIYFRPKVLYHAPSKTYVMCAPTLPSPTGRGPTALPTGPARPTRTSRFLSLKAWRSGCTAGG